MAGIFEISEPLNGSRESEEYFSESHERTAFEHGPDCLHYTVDNFGGIPQRLQKNSTRGKWLRFQYQQAGRASRFQQRGNLMTVFSKIKRATAMIALGGVTLLITLSGSHAAQGKLVVAQ